MTEGFNFESRASRITGRTLGVDLGTKRIGIAVSDANCTLASPVSVIQRSGNPSADHRKIAEIAHEEEAVRIVIGIPTALDGTDGIAALAIKEELQALRDSVDLPVETWDERMTSAAANKALAAQNISEKKRRQHIDKWAAANILQGWLDRYR